MRPSSPYDTPPNGDFARYAEQLSQPARTPARAPRPGMQQLPPPAGQPARQEALAPFAPFKRLAQGALVVYLAYVMGAVLFPPLAWLGPPLLLAFLVFALLRLRKLPWRELITPTRRDPP